jgi:hypothetical protein
VTSGPLAALVSPVEASPVEANRRNLLAHADIVEEVFESTTVLPLRFGVLMAGAGEVRRGLLDPAREHLERLLDDLDGLCELSLKGSYDEEAVLAEIMARSPSVARLRDRYRAAPSLETGMALGEAVAAELERRRDRDARHLLAELDPVARDVRAGQVATERGLVNLAFLVPRADVGEFEDRLRGVSESLSPPARFKLVGPLPPYSFVDVPLAVAA